MKSLANGLHPGEDPRTDPFLVRHPKGGRIPWGFIRSVLLSTDYVLIHH